MAITSEVVKLTKVVVDRAQPVVIEENPRQKLYFDTELKGFGLCVGVKSKTFFAQRNIRGKPLRVTIGRYGVFTVDQARGEARQLLAQMAKGVNPTEALRKEAARGVTLAEAWELYRDMLKAKRRSQKTIDGYQYALDTYLKGWLNKPLVSLSRQDVRNWHHNIAKDVAAGKYSKGRDRTEEHGLYTANGVMRVFRAIYNRAMKQHEELPVNPCINIDWYEEERRCSAIHTDQLEEWYTAVMALKNNIRRNYLRFVLFTGLRRQNAAEARWEHVNFEGRLLHVPKPKSQRPFDLPLSDYLIDLLKVQQKDNETFFPNSPWLFPALSKHGHIAEPREELGIPYSIHDLRRVFITVAEGLDISPYAIKALVNHGLPKDDVTAGYIAHEVERLRAPMQAITARLLAIVEKPRKVVKIRKQRKA